MFCKVDALGLLLGVGGCGGGGGGGPGGTYRCLRPCMSVFAGLFFILMIIVITLTHSTLVFVIINISVIGHHFF